MQNPFAIPAQRIAQEMAEFARDVGIEGLAFYQGSFRKQGFEDVSVEKWEKRKPILIKKKGVYISKPNDSNRAILVKSGRLRRSLRKSVSGMEITFASDLPYAQIHNEGGAVRTRNGRTYYRMAKRQYMGESQTLNTKVGEMFTQRMDKLYNNQK